MKTLFYAAILILLTTGSTVFAAEQQGAHNDEHHQQEKGEVHSGHGKIVSVNAAAGTVKIAHDPIDTLNWKKMTMDFKAHDPAMLKGLTPGTIVNFELTKMGGEYHVTTMTPGK